MLMDEFNRASRREFTAQAVMALLSGATITISSCGGSTPSEPSSPPGGGGGSGATGAITENHGHTATITAAQISSGTGVTLQIRGTADHPHTLALTMAEVVQVGAGGRVSKTSSSDDAHTHVVTFN
jgi:hypothetical protein